MTEDELRAIEARAEAATAGPWTIHVEAFAAAAWLSGVWQGYEGEFGVPDAAFIAAARTDVPALIAEIRRLQDRLEMRHAWCNGERLEVEPGSIPDGIDCRDETIRLQDKHIAELEERDRRLRALASDISSSLRYLRAFPDAPAAHESAAESLAAAVAEGLLLPLPGGRT